MRTPAGSLRPTFARARASRHSPLASPLLAALLLLAIVILVVPAGRPAGSSASPAPPEPARTGAPVPGALIASIGVGKNPLPPAVDPSSGDVYVANYDVSNLSVLSASEFRVAATIRTATQPVTPAIDLATGDVYVPTEGTNNLSVFASGTDALVTTVPVPAVPLPLTPLYDPANGDLYVTSALSTNVVVVSGSTNSVVAVLPVPGHPLLPTLDPANGDVYVPIEGTGNLSVIDGAANRVIANLSLAPSYLQAGTFDSATGELYFPELSAVASTGAVIVVGGTPGAVVASVPVGALPETPVVDPANGDVYVANYGSDNVTVIDAASDRDIASVTTGDGPNVPALDAATGDLFVSNVASGNVTVISGADQSVVRSVPVGLDPEAAVYDPENAAVYVANKGSNNVSVLADGSAASYAATFAESGLPAGATWTVTVAGVAHRGAAGGAAFSLPDGIYPFSVSASSGCVPALGGHSLTVDGAASIVHLRFTGGACTVWLGVSVSLWSTGAIFAGLAMACLGLAVRAREVRRATRARRDAEIAAGAIPRELRGPRDASASPASRFRRASGRRRGLLISAAIAVAAVLLGAYLVGLPGSRTSPGPTATSPAKVVLGNVTLGVVPCRVGPAAVVERIPWERSSVRFTTEQVVLVVVDLDGDTLWSSGPSPSVTATDDCAGALPAPNWTGAASGVNVGFSWYVVLSGPSGTNVAYYTLTNGWLPIGAGPWPVPIENGSALTFVCNPSISRLGAYQLEATYHLEIGSLVTAGAGAAIVGSTAL